MAFGPKWKGEKIERVRSPAPRDIVPYRFMCNQGHLHPTFRHASDCNARLRARQEKERAKHWKRISKLPFGAAPRRCKVSTKALARGTRIEHREHPSFSKSAARRIARDHLCRNPKAYSKEK